MLENPQVVGVKNSSMPVQDIQRFRQIAGDDFNIFNGPDEQFVAGRVLGANAGIGGTYAMMPELFLAADACVKASDMDKALKIQHAINDMIYTACSCHGNLYSVIKEVLRRRGMDIGQARLPLAPCIAEDEATIDTIIRRLDAYFQDFVVQ